MRKHLFTYLSIAVIICLNSCKGKQEHADMILYNTHIITMNDSLPEASVLVIKGDKIVAVGSEQLLKQYECSDSNKMDMAGQYIYPGFIDAHCHFYGYAKTNMTCDLTGTKSWEEVIERVVAYSKKDTSGWILGRGWDQNDWAIKDYPTNDELNRLFPNRPVFLKRVDGHAAICNKNALAHTDLAFGVVPGWNSEILPRIEGGELLVVNNEFKGVLIDNAVDLVEKVVPKPETGEFIESLNATENECYSKGLTCVADAGLEKEECLFLDSLQNKGILSIYMYLMLNPNKKSMDYAKSKGIYETDRVRIGSFKVYADGALGSRGALLKQVYHDHQHAHGLSVNSPEFIDSFVKEATNNTQYQVNTHCIGDSANKLVLSIYGQYLKGSNDRRYRIEHSQIVEAADWNLFKKFNIIPSVQPTHATSDGPWVEERLGQERMSSAYPYKSLLKVSGILALGTDFPVEDINPLYTFYSAVYRKDMRHPERAPFLINEALSPLEALLGMTKWAAYACKLDHRKGMIKTGYDADLTILNTNLLKAKEQEAGTAKVIATIRAGRFVYKIK
jgi:predicted amidohydrolase YtcJ